jgi:hypothetical protein
MDTITTGFAELVKGLTVDQLLTCYAQAAVKVAECDYSALHALEVVRTEIVRRIG